MKINILSNQDGNNLIKNYISNNVSFSVGRVGSPEILSTEKYDKKIPYTDDLIYLLSNNAGVYGNVMDEFSEEYLNSIKYSDIQVFWEIPQIIEAQNYIFKKFFDGKPVVSNRSVEPFYFQNPWSSELRNKKVLVISPFVESIKSQYKNKDLIWENKNILPDFELITYKPIQSIGNTGPHSSWVESLTIMKQDIKNIDFDIAILGCGGYGMPLGSFIKTELKKSSIYIGGGLQIMFGIKGKRWEQHEISSFFNSYWIYPNDDETPNNHKLIEGGCYWK